MKKVVLLIAGWFACVPISARAAAAEGPFAAEDIQFFETRIRPVLVQHCYECHSSASAEVKAGLVVDFRGGIRKGGESGPLVVPGKPEDSLLMNVLRHESFEMPPAGKLPDAVIADFAKWIRKGAADPRDKAPTAAESARSAWQAQIAERSHWWSLQPLKTVTLPVAKDETDTWSQNPVDRFVRSALDNVALPPAPSADAATLLRRLTFVLTGLPPQPDKVNAFPTDFAMDPDQALGKLVDELLESPRFGERFARHWMDVVRYTDTYGYEWDNPAKGSWEYRDYLIRAFNDDIPFDQLIREQIAGDLLPHPRINQAAGVNESLIGPMFFHLGEHRHGTSLDFNGIHQEMINNKVDAFSKAFLAMTVACARCHDHKLDAIAQADYYALAGVFMSPRWTSRVIDAPAKHDVEISQLKTLREQIHDEVGNLWRGEVAKLGSSLRKWAEDNRSALEKAKIDNLTFPLLTVLDATDENVAQRWQAMSDQYATARETRLKVNASGFNVLTDFDQPGLPADWTTEGDGILHGFVEDGAPLVSLHGDTLIDQLLPRGYHTHALSSKLPGAIRLPAQDAIPGQFVSLQLRGSEWSGYLVVPQNAFNSEAVTFLDPKNDTYKWIPLADRALKNGVTRVFTEVATSALNPNFPPRTGLARAATVKLPDDDDGFDKRSWFSLTGIVTHDGGGTPQDALDIFVKLFDGHNSRSETDLSRRDTDVDPKGETEAKVETPAIDQAASGKATSDQATSDQAASDRPAIAPPATVELAWRRTAEWFAGAVHRWSTRAADDADVVLINWLLEQKLLSNQQAEAPAVASLVRRYREVESQIAFPRTANSMDERNVAPLNYRLNVRGNVDDEGPAIPRNFLAVFAGKHEVAASGGSGRLELAKYLGSRDNPQTARVYVNRVWQWVFGQGIVATPSDFGKLGDAPSHPELLDWLAGQFMDEGWSTKQLVRRLVLSQTFRQAGVVTLAAADRDPDNRLLHHYATRRLEAEAIRDSLLAVSNRLETKLYGRPINPPRAVDDPAKRLFSGPLDSQGRRSIYMKMSIMAPPKFLVCFNLPDLKLPTGRRDVTNVPAQALALLNDPLTVQLAEQWATQLMHDGCREPQDRVRAMFIRALGRAPSNVEIRRWTNAVKSFSQTGDAMTDKAAWAELAHVFFNTKEFIYYR